MPTSENDVKRVNRAVMTCVTNREPNITRYVIQRLL